MMEWLASSRRMIGVSVLLHLAVPRHWAAVLQSAKANNETCVKLMNILARAMGPRVQLS